MGGNQELKRSLFYAGIVSGTRYLLTSKAQISSVIS